MNPEGGFIMITNPVVLLLRKLMKKEQNKKSSETGSIMLIANVSHVDHENLLQLRPQIN